MTDEERMVRGHLVVFDLDGTLSLTEHREHFLKRPPGEKDWDAFYDACDRDRPNSPFIATYLALSSVGFDIQIWTGRTDRVREKTIKWLAEHGIHDPVLVMREHGDHRPDTDLKAEWLREASRRPFLVFEDRASVVAMWRSNGIACAHVADGAF